MMQLNSLDILWYLRIIFIHSDMYEASVTDYKNASSISSNDTFTSGCIRISQDNLNKLLSIILVGTTVIL